MEVTRNAQDGRPFIQRYRGGGFAISGTAYAGAVVVLPTQVIAWPVHVIADLDPAWLVAALGPAQVDICLIGAGTRPILLPAATRQIFRDAKIGVDLMETGAACRVFNVLTGEGRAVAAALIPLS